MILSAIPIFFSANSNYSALRKISIPVQKLAFLKWHERQGTLCQTGRLQTVIMNYENMTFRICWGWSITRLRHSGSEAAIYHGITEVAKKLHSDHRTLRTLRKNHPWVSKRMNDNHSYVTCTKKTRPDALAIWRWAVALKENLALPADRKTDRVE